MNSSAWQSLETHENNYALIVFLKKHLATYHLNIRIPLFHLLTSLH